MNWQPGGGFEGVLLLLAKGAVWLALCGAARWVLPRFAPSWRRALTGLLVLTTAGLLPSLWIWTLPAPEIPGIPPTVNRPVIPVEPVSANPYSSKRDMPPPLPHAPVDSRFSWRTFAFLIWAGGSAGLVCWLLFGFRIARRWVRDAMPPEDPTWHLILLKECHAQPLRRLPRILVSQTVPGPCVVGCFRPVLLLPDCSGVWDSETKTLVIRHELAHLRHHDAPHALIRAITLTLHWMNPLVWLAVSRSRHAEELAADAAVLASGVRPAQYAATLLQVARACQFNTLTPLATAMAHSSNLESRVRQVLGKTPSSPSHSPARFVAAGIGLTLVTAGFIGCSSVERKSPDPNDMNLPGARTPNTSIDVVELGKLYSAEPSKAQRFTIQCQIIDLSGQILGAPGITPSESRIFPQTLTLRPGQIGQLQSLREFPYPTRFNLPGLKPFSPPSSAGGGSFPVTPTTPLEFQFRNIGWEASQLTVRKDGALLMISGIFRETTFDGFIQNAGEAFSPLVTKGRNVLGMEENVVLSDNKVLAPTFTQRETPFSIAAVPGKTYRLRLNLKQPDAFLQITCTPEGTMKN